MYLVLGHFIFVSFLIFGGGIGEGLKKKKFAKMSNETKSETSNAHKGAVEPTPYLLVSLRERAPHLGGFLGDVSEGDARIVVLNLLALFSGEDQIGRLGSLGNTVVLLGLLGGLRLLLAFGLSLGALA
jgi:hypothetical protein